MAAFWAVSLGRRFLVGLGRRSMSSSVVVIIGLIVALLLFF